MESFQFFGKDLELPEICRLPGWPKKTKVRRFFLWVTLGPHKITPVSYGKKMKMLLLFRFFFTRRGVLEINRLDKIARRSKRLGGAIADLWGSHFTIRLVLKNKNVAAVPIFFSAYEGAGNK